MRIASLPRVQLRWIVLFGLLAALLLRPLIHSAPVAASSAVNVTLVSSSQWTEQLGSTTLVHLVGEVRNDDSIEADLIQVHFNLLSGNGGTTVIGPETVDVWNMGADILGPGQLSPFHDVFPAPPNYDHAVFTSITAAVSPFPPDRLPVTNLHNCPDVQHICGTVTNPAQATVDNVRVLFTFYADLNHTQTVDTDLLTLPNNPTSSLDAQQSFDFQLDRSSDVLYAATAVFAESATTAPGPPTNVSAMPANSSATVSWTAPADGGRSITSYTITATPGDQTAAKTMTVAGNLTSTSFSGLTNGTSYTFTVAATNGVGTGHSSTPSAPITPATHPDKPTSVVATLTGDHSASVNWSEPANGGSVITKYTVTSAPGGITATVTGSPPATSTSVSGLSSGTTYTFTVTATNAMGTSDASDQSNSVTTPTPTPQVIPLGAPTNVTATAGFGFATVNWTASSADPSQPVTSYTVVASPFGATVTVSGNVTSAMVGGLAKANYTFMVTATNTAGATAASSPSNSASVNAAGQYHPMAPIRILDTRDGEGGILQGPLGPRQTIRVPILARFGVPPSGVAAVVMNVTVTQPTAPSYLAIYPTGSVASLPPSTSSLNYVAGQTVPNLVVATLGADGSVTAYNNAGSVQVIFDVQGWISTPDNSTGTSGQFRPVVPVRLLDTRIGFGGFFRLGTGSTINLTVAGIPSVPASASAVVLNVTATNPSFPGYVTVYPSGQARPQPASNLNFVAGLTVPNRVMVKVGTNGQVNLFNLQGGVDLIVDLNGWFTDASDPSATGGEFTGIKPTRILDTRDGFHSPVAQGGTLTLQVAGNGGVPSMSSQTPPTAVVLNVTVTNTTVAGHLRVFPSDAGLPNTSDLNWMAAGSTTPNLVVVKLSSDGKVSFYNCCGSTDVIVDVLGWYSAPAQKPT